MGGSELILFYSECEKMFGFGKRDESKEEDNYATSFDAARRQSGSETSSLPTASASRSASSGAAVS